MCLSCLALSRACHMCSVWLTPFLCVLPLFFLAWLTSFYGLHITGFILFCLPQHTPGTSSSIPSSSLVSSSWTSSLPLPHWAAPNSCFGLFYSKGKKETALPKSVAPLRKGCCAEVPLLLSGLSLSIRACRGWLWGREDSELVPAVLWLSCTSQSCEKQSIIRSAMKLFTVWNHLLVPLMVLYSGGLILCGKSVTELRSVSHNN